MACKHRREKKRIRLELERLEDRTVPAIITVSNISELRAAVASANNFDLIQMTSGSYFTQGTPIQMLNVAKNLSIQAGGAGVILDGGVAGNIFGIGNPNIGNPGTAVQFLGITFQSGLSTTTGIGGALSIQNANVTFSACTFTNNNANTPTGGGAANVSGNSVVQFNNCTLNSNGSTVTGGAIEIQGGAKVTVQGCLFVNNFTNGPGHASATTGGAIHVGNASLTAYNTRFEGNHSAAFGGAIHAQGVFGVGTASVVASNCTFVNNGALLDAANPAPTGTEGGAVVIEDATTGEFDLCRFDNNQAQSGGAFSIYRGSVAVHQSEFTNNRATAVGPGTGLGGAIFMLSNDLASDGNINRPNASLLIDNSYITGAPNGAGTVAQQGGAIFVSGDRNRLQGNGIPQGGAVPDNQGQCVVQNVIFAYVNVQETGTVGNANSGSGNGGAIFSDLGNVTIANSVFLSCQARPIDPNNASSSNTGGGGLGAVGESTINISNTTFVNDSAGREGGALFVKGSVLNVTGSKFLNNSLEFTSSTAFDYRGSAISAEIDLFLPPVADQVPGFATGSVVGTVANSLFSENSGIVLFDADSPSGSIINGMVYNSNQFFVDPNSQFGNPVNASLGLVYTSNVDLNQYNVSGFNQVFEPPGTTRTRKTDGQNVFQSGQTVNTPPVVSQLFAAPNRLYTFTTPFDSSQTTPVFVAFVISGVPGGILLTPTGPQAVNTPGGVIQTAATGTYSLTVLGAPQAVTQVTKPTLLATGPDAGGAPYLHVYDALTGNLVESILVYNPFFSGGVRVAMGDVNGDGFIDFITTTGPGGGPDVKVFDGKTGNSLLSFFAYDMNFTGGVFVAVGDINGDGFADIICGADRGGGPNVTAFKGSADVSTTRKPDIVLSFFPYDINFTGGVRVSSADVDGDGRAEIITGAGPGGGPNVTIYKFNNGQPQVFASYFAYDIRFSAGIFVAAGDVEGTGKADIITGADIGGGPNILVSRAIDQAPIFSFFPYDPRFTGGVRVGSVDANQDGRADVIVGAGKGGGPNVKVIDGLGLLSQQSNVLDEFFAYDTSFSGGIYVAGR